MARFVFFCYDENHWLLCIHELGFDKLEVSGFEYQMATNGDFYLLENCFLCIQDVDVLCFE